MSDRIEVIDVTSSRGASVLALAEQLGQRQYLERHYDHAREQHVFAHIDDNRVDGFLLLLVQVIGNEEGRSPILRDGQPLIEGYVNAFGVHPDQRRRGIGRALQEAAIRHCRTKGCYQIRSRSPVTAIENYALKLAMGYTIQPSNENDSYYFIKQIDGAARDR